MHERIGKIGEKYWKICADTIHRLEDDSNTEATVFFLLSARL